MVLFGTLVNAILIIAGTLIGRLLKDIPENMKQTVMYAIGIVVMVMGIQMGLESSNFVIIIICIVLGAVVGEWLDIDKWINRLGQTIEKSLVQKNKQIVLPKDLLQAHLYL